MTELPIRDLRLDEVDLAARFFHEHWRPNHIFYRNHELLLWMFHKSPAALQWNDRLTIKAAFDGGEIVGFFGYIPFFCNHYGKQQLGAHLSTWWVNPEYRRSPLGLRLMREIQYEMGFAVCVAGMITPVAASFYKIARWRMIDNIPRWVFPVRQDAMLEMLPKQNRQFHENAKLLFDRKIPRAFGANGSFSKSLKVQELSSLSELYELGWDEFYWRAIAPTYMSPSRTVSTLVWRYHAIPVFTYKTLVVFCENNICGLLIYRLEPVKDHEEKVLRIVDICCTPNALPTLLDEIISIARAQNTVLVDFFCTNTSFDKLMKDHGFISDSSPDGRNYLYPYLFQPLDMSNLSLNAAWWIKDASIQAGNVRDEFLLTKGDYEFDRPN